MNEIFFFFKLKNAAIFYPNFTTVYYYNLLNIEETYFPFKIEFFQIFLINHEIIYRYRIKLFF